MAPVPRPGGESALSPAGSEPAGLLEHTVRWLHRLEDLLLAVILSSMIGLAATQLVLRNVFDSGIAWADPLLSASVLWVGLLGALAASRGDHQIRIDILSRGLPPRPRQVIHGLTSLFASVVAGVIAWQGWRFLRSDMEFGTEAFAGVQVWMIEVVIPFAFAGIALRYLLLAAALLRGSRQIHEP